MSRGFRCWIAAMAIGVCTFTSAVSAAVPGCDADPLPQVPAAGVPSYSFGVFTSSEDAARIELWRLPCPGERHSRLMVRITPMVGYPAACGPELSMVQGTRPYFNFWLLESATSTSSDCGRLFRPTVFRLYSCSCEDFDPDMAFTIQHHFNGEQTTSFDVPAADPDAIPTIVPYWGLYWNPNEPGTGYSIAASDETLVMVIFSFQADGAPEWYYVTGPLTDGGRKFTGSLDKYRGGQCIQCVNYGGMPTLAGSDGTVTLEFTLPYAATVTLPGGRVIDIERMPF